MRKYTIALTSMIVASSLVLAACGGSQNPSNGSNSGSTGSTGGNTVTPKAPDFGGEMSFSVVADPDTLAPFWRTSAYAADVIDRVYGIGLLRIGADLQPTPYLAEAMPEVSADGMTYTFKIRKGVKFHDGVELTSEHVVYTYELLMHDDYVGPFKGSVASIASVKAVDEYTVDITTKETFAPFMFSSASLYIMPKHLLEGVAIKDMPTWDGWTKPVGIGPWKFVEWKTGQHTLLERNPDFFQAGTDGFVGGKVGPWIDRLRIKVIPDSNTEIAALEAGELTYVTQVDPEQVDRLAAEHAGKLIQYDWNRLGYGYQTFNNDKWPTNILEVRQALSHSLNRDAIIGGIMDNKAVKPAGFVPPIHWAFDAKLTGYDYDVKKAEELLTQAGFVKNAQGVLEKDGQPLKLTYVASSGSNVVEGIALASQSDWGKLGIQVDLHMVDFNTMLDRHLKPGDYHVTFSGLNFTVDPHTSFNGFHSREIRLDDKGVAQGSNRARYTNSRVDELIDLGKVTVDLEERKQIYHEAQSLIVADAPANWIYVNLWTDFAQKDLKGVVNLDGFGMSYDTQWYLSEK